MKDAMFWLCLLVWNLAVLLGFGYVIFGLGHSPWWALVAITLVKSGKSDDAPKSKTEGG